MAHEFSSGMFVGEKAWHGLGTVLDKAPETSEEAIKLAGLDWIAEKREMFVLDKGGNNVKVPNQFAVVKTDDDSVLGTVGNRYTILQNSEAFQFFDPIIDQKIGEYETAGALMGNSRVWILAKLTGDFAVDDKKEDVVKRYVLLSNSHDGTGTVIAKITPIRVVCNNTLTAAIRQKGFEGDEVKIRHTKNVGDRVKEASKLLDTINKRYEYLQKVYEAMYQLKLPKVSLLSYVQSVLPDPENVENTKRLQTKRAEIIQLMSDTNLNVKIEDNLWQAYNAVTAYADHVQSGRKNSSEEKHLESTWFGDRAKLKTKALEVAQEFLSDAGVSL